MAFTVSFLSPVDRMSCPVLLAIMSQLLPPQERL
jgi:hypothetical protein